MKDYKYSLEDISKKLKYDDYFFLESSMIVLEGEEKEIFLKDIEKIEKENFKLEEISDKQLLLTSTYLVANTLFGGPVKTLLTNLLFSKEKEDIETVEDVLYFLDFINLTVMKDSTDFIEENIDYYLKNFSTDFSNYKYKDDEKENDDLTKLN